MYPQADLDTLEQRKRVLLRKIDVRRQTCSGQIDRVLQPVLWIEGAVAKWRVIFPFLKVAAVPLGLVFVKRKMSPQAGGVAGGLLRWAPLALSLFRSTR